MATKEIYDQWGDVVRVVHQDDPNDFFSTFTIQTVQNLEPLEQLAKDIREQQVDARFKTGKRETFTHVAFLGVSAGERMLVENWDDKYLDKYINDPESLGCFKTYEGRV
ncbi:hypothetical protein JNW90_13665 [Micromonospora sp. STR1s_5]|nr:hypothetical protein [Micromonospora sp. STR1s_5]